MSAAAPTIRSTLTYSSLCARRTGKLARRAFASTTLPRSASSTHASSSSSTAPDASTVVLLNSIASIPRYGFTRRAYLSSSQLDAGETSRRARVLATLFPGPPSHFDSQLFRAWSRVCDLAVIHRLPVEGVLQLLRTGQDVGAERGAVSMRAALTANEEEAALAEVASVVEERLKHSWSVKQHLTHGLTSLCTLSPTSSKLHSIVPHETLLPNLPTPLPLLRLSSAFIDAVLTEGGTGWVDPDGPAWYAVRARLVAAYTAATLHVAAERAAGFEESRGVFRRVLEGRKTGVVATMGEVGARVGEWTRWGGRGWLSVLRSLGL